MISNESFHVFLSEGLFQCYCRKAGPIQEIQLVYKDKTDITILETRKIFDITEIDFIGDFVEEKIINADLSKPMHIQTELCDVKGTLWIGDNKFQDLYMEIHDETI